MWQIINKQPIKHVHYYKFINSFLQCSLDMVNLLKALTAYEHIMP